MKNKINAVIARVSSQPLAAGDIGPMHELDALGINQDKQLDLVLSLERTIKDLNDLTIDIPDDIWPDWKSVADIYRFYGVAK